MTTAKALQLKMQAARAAKDWKVTKEIAEEILKVDSESFEAAVSLQAALVELALEAAKTSEERISNIYMKGYYPSDGYSEKDGWLLKVLVRDLVARIKEIHEVNQLVQKLDR